MPVDEKGWFSVHRKINDNWIAKDKPFNYYGAWVYFLSSANHKPRKIPFSDKIRTVNRGEFITSQNKLGEFLGWSRSKVYRFLKRLSSDNMIEFITGQNSTLIKILNYEDYQDPEQRPINKGANISRNARRTKTEHKTNNKTNNNSDNGKAYNISSYEETRTTNEQPFEQQTNNKRATREQRAATNNNINNENNEITTIATAVNSLKKDLKGFESSGNIYDDIDKIFLLAWQRKPRNLGEILIAEKLFSEYEPKFIFQAFVKASSRGAQFETLAYVGGILKKHKEQSSINKERREAKLKELETRGLSINDLKE